MDLNDTKTRARLLGTALIVIMIGIVYTSVAESGAFFLTGTIGAMSTGLLWSE